MSEQTIISSGGRGDVRWQVATRLVAPDLVPFVRGLYGYVERSPVPLLRRELPVPQVVVIFELGAPIRLWRSNAEYRMGQHFQGGFVGGLDDTFTLTEFRTEQRGVQLNLTPIGARLLFGMPVHELAGEVVALSDALRVAPDFTERLAVCRTWEQRFERIEALLRLRLRALEPEDRMMLRAFERIVSAGGQIQVSELVRSFGYSHKHVLALVPRACGHVA